MADICETVTGHSMAEVIRARDEAVDADLVEVRLDGVSDADAGRALAGRTKPVVITCRARWEGGYFDGSEDERLRMLGTAVDLGADYVDLEWRGGPSELDAGIGPDEVDPVASRHERTAARFWPNARERCGRKSRPWSNSP